MSLGLTTSYLPSGILVATVTADILKVCEPTSMTPIMLVRLRGQCRDLYDAEFMAYYVLDELQGKSVPRLHIHH